MHDHAWLNLLRWRLRGAGHRVQGAPGPQAVRNLTLQVMFTRGGELLFQGVDWYWITTGVTRAVRKGVASFQEDWRHAGLLLEDLMASKMTPSLPFSKWCQKSRFEMCFAPKHGRCWLRRRVLHPVHALEQQLPAPRKHHLQREVPDGLWTRCTLYTMPRAKLSPLFFVYEWGCRPRSRTLWSCHRPLCSASCSQTPPSHQARPSVRWCSAWPP